MDKVSNPMAAMSMKVILSMASAKAEVRWSSQMEENTRVNGPTVYPTDKVLRPMNQLAIGLKENT